MTGRAGRAILAALAAVALAGCAEQRRLTLDAAPPDLVDPSATLELHATETIAERHGFVVAGAGQGAGTGALAGAGAMIVGGASTADPFGLILGVVLAPPAAVIGGVAGAAAAHPADETEAAVAAMERVYADIDALGAMPPRLASQIDAAGQGIDLCGADLPPCEPDAPRNQWRLSVAYSFETKGAYTPDLIVSAVADLTAVSAAKDAETRQYRWVYTAPETDFFAATENDAAILRQSIGAIADDLAETMVDDLFLIRRAVVANGVYVGGEGTGHFAPKASPVGVAVRVPTDYDLLFPGELLEAES